MPAQTTHPEIVVLRPAGRPVIVSVIYGGGVFLTTVTPISKSYAGNTVLKRVGTVCIRMQPLVQAGEITEGDNLSGIPFRVVGGLKEATNVRRVAIKVTIDTCDVALRVGDADTRTSSHEDSKKKRVVR